MFKRIHVAVDGSKLAGNAARLSAKLASAAEASLIVVSVTGTRSVASRQILVARLAGELRSTWVEAVGTIRLSESRDVGLGLLEAAREQGADLIATGSCGRTELGALILESASHTVIAAAECPVLSLLHAARRPVLIVHRPAGANGAAGR